MKDLFRLPWRQAFWAMLSVSIVYYTVGQHQELNKEFRTQTFDHVKHQTDSFRREALSLIEREFTPIKTQLSSKATYSETADLRKEIYRVELLVTSMETKLLHLLQGFSKETAEIRAALHSLETKAVEQLREIENQQSRRVQEVWTTVHTDVQALDRRLTVSEHFNLDKYIHVTK